MFDVCPVRAFLEPRHVEFARDFAAWVQQEIAPLPSAADDAAARAQAPEMLRALGRSGWLARALGTTGDLRTSVIVRETLAAASPLADAVYALQALGSMPIRLAGNTDMQRRWLAAVEAGEAMAAFAMTEPEAGSDVSSMRTTARREGDDYVIEGVKHLISNAGIADFYTVFAATDPTRGNHGLSCFVVDARTPGCRFTGPQRLSCPHPLGTLTFEQCRVPAACRLGEEGAGFKLGMATLDRLRTTVGAAACGLAARALDEATGYARRRVQFGKALAEQPLIQQKLARMVIDLTAARLLVSRAAWEKDAGAERVTLESAIAKSFATEAAQRIVDEAVQIHGGIGVLAGSVVERLYLAVRPLRVYEGTTEILDLVIAGQWLRKSAGGA